MTYELIEVKPSRKRKGKKPKAETVSATAKPARKPRKAKSKATPSARPPQATNQSRRLAEPTESHPYAMVRMTSSSGGRRPLSNTATIFTQLALRSGMGLLHAELGTQESGEL